MCPAGRLRERVARNILHKAGMAALPITATVFPIRIRRQVVPSLGQPAPVMCPAGGQLDCDIQVGGGEQAQAILAKGLGCMFLDGDSMERECILLEMPNHLHGLRR